MIGLIDKATGDLICFSEDTSGYDMALYDAVAAPDDHWRWMWGVQTQAFVLRPPTPREETQAGLDADPRWQAMMSASPDQIEAWLSANVNDLASARRVLKMLAMGIQLALKVR